VLVSDLSDASVQAHAGPLLHHVRSFVRRDMKARRAGEGDTVTGRESLRAHGRAAQRSRAIGMGPDPRYVVLRSERRLDLIKVRYRTACA
jgi:hypothetical protein